mgnify:CR=1 FL=1
MHISTVVRRGALASLFGGLIFVPYALWKSAVTTRIEATGWHLPGVSVDATNQLFHAFEAVPVLLMAAGVAALAANHENLRYGAGRVGVVVALGGFAAITVFHWAEHLYPTVAVSVATASVGVFEAGYYVGWVTTNLGLFVCGLVLTRSPGRSETVGRVLALPLPIATAVSCGAVLTGVYTFAGTHRLVAAMTWILVGALLWLGRNRNSVNSREAPSTTGFSR